MSSGDQGKQTKVRILMGSKSDAETMKHCQDLLSEFGVSNEVRVLSAHRTPAEVVEWVSEARDCGVQVIIAAAGLAAHLAGVCAAHTTLPVIGVPMDGGPLNGFDALLSTVQMPKGTPVASVAIGRAGAVNAALLALRILALSDSVIAQKVADHQVSLATEVLEAGI